jgi:NADH-quinone oxidoreductase subunit L
LLPIILAASGVILAVVAYIVIPSLPARIATMFAPLYRFFFNKWYFDELYDRIFVAPSVAVGQMLWQRGDKGVIDYYGPDGLSGFVKRSSGMLTKLQSGYVYHYAFAMMIGVVVLLSWYFSGFGR